MADKKQERPIDQCSDCGKDREIYNVQLNLCNTCNRRRLREIRRRERGPVIRHTLSRDAQTMLGAYTKQVQVFTTLGVGKEDRLDIMAILEPYLATVAEYIASTAVKAPEKDPQDE